MVRKKTSSSPSSSSDLSDDQDTEEALKGFDFLVSPDEMDGSPDVRSAEDRGDWGEGGLVGWLMNTQTRMVKFPCGPK